MGYIGLKLLNIFGKLWDILVIGCNYPNLWEILGKIVGYIRPKLGDILWDISVKSCGIYLTKTKGKMGKTMG